MRKNISIGHRRERHKAEIQKGRQVGGRKRRLDCPSIFHHKGKPLGDLRKRWKRSYVAAGTGTVRQGRARPQEIGLTCGLVQIIIAADNIKTAHDFTSSHNRHHLYLLIHSHEMLLQQRDIRRKFRVHCEGVGAWQRNP
jgi:hypothetical protein